MVERDRLGGICLNWGCIPTKALLRSSEIWHLMHRLGEFGFSADNFKFDIGKIVAQQVALYDTLTSHRATTAGPEPARDAGGGPLADILELPWRGALEGRRSREA